MKFTSEVYLQRGGKNPLWTFNIRPDSPKLCGQMKGPCYPDKGRAIAELNKILKENWHRRPPQ